MSSSLEKKNQNLNSKEIDNLTLNKIAEKGRECMNNLPEMNFQKIKNPILKKIKGKIKKNNFNDS